MKRVLKAISANKRRVALISIIGASLAALMLYKLGTLTPGLSNRELATTELRLGWHGLYNNPFNFPLNFLRSGIFFAIDDYGQFLLRLPNVLFGVLGILSFGYIVRRWHGTRTALLATALFATSAWTLHVSRIATLDVMYFWAIPVLLCSGILMQRYADRALVFYGSVIIWVVMLYTPGLIWLVLLTLFWQASAIADGWKHFKRWWQRLGYVLLGLAPLPLLVLHLTRPGRLLAWLGAPEQFAAPLTMLKQLGGVFVHLFIRGPQYPDIWLGRLPILDIFTLAMCVIGIYFYATHRKAFRTRLLLSYFIVGVLLVALSGPVGLSLVVPMLFIVAATGIAYLLREWLQVFPLNPFARRFGIALIAIAVSVSCIYNLRSYFVAWPYNDVTKSTFRYHR